MRTSQLDQIVRQKDPELLRAVEHLSRNETATGVQLLQQQGRITEIPDRQQRIEAIAKDYVARPENTLIVTPDNASRRDINDAVRAELQNSGALSKENHPMTVLTQRSDLTSADRNWAALYQPADVLYYTRGSKELGIERGTYATVVATNPKDNQLTVERQDGQHVSYRAFLCVIPGTVLADIYQKFGSRLLEGNVRSYLGTRGRINKMIRKTVTTEPTMFFAYNNGISATATKAVVVPYGDGLRLTEVTDLQIVNGGQTTATLASALADKEAGLVKTFVQMKLSEVTPETNGKYTPLIARYANSQNKVSDADFYSNQEFHQRIEQISRLLRAPALGGAQYGTHWRYERARGTYMNEQAKLSPAQRMLFQLQNPGNQLITKVDLAKFENAWRFLPNVVSYGAQKNFVAFST